MRRFVSLVHLCIDRERFFLQNKISPCLVYTISIFIALSLVTAIALLIWYLLTPEYLNYTNSTCSPNPCPSTITISTSSIQNTMSEFIFLNFIIH
jgi:hypothetical protein